MHKKIITTVFSLISLLMCLPVQAAMYPTPDSSINTVFIGRIDSIHPNAKVIIVNEMVLSYDIKSKFFDQIKSPILNIPEQIQQGSHIKYRLESRENSSYLLIELQLITKQEFNALNNTHYDY